jgi:hypothetical protein
MHWALLMSVGGALLSSGQILPSGETPPAVQGKSPEEIVQSLKQAYSGLEEQVTSIVSSAPVEQRSKLLEQRLRPETERYAAQFLEIARKNPQSPAALTALAWVLAPRDWHIPEQEGQAIDLLLNDHLSSEKLAGFCALMIYDPPRRAEPFLRIVLEKSPHRSQQGAACYCLARHLHEKAKSFQTSSASQLAALEAESERLLDRALNRFGDVPVPARPGKPETGEKVADAAKKDLYEIRFLSIGKKAPEITGQDVDGKSFKLSDYQGKVVLLDFWGHW